MGLDRLLEFANATDPEQTTYEEMQEVPEEFVQSLFESHQDTPPISPMAVERKFQIIESIRWTLVMDEIYDISTRRLAAQRKVAQHHNRSNRGTEGEDEDDGGVSLQAVQQKVREMFDGRCGRQNAQEHFDEVLEDIEAAYQERMKAR